MRKLLNIQIEQLLLLLGHEEVSVRLQTLETLAQVCIVEEQ